jgi:hypothetical protein
VGGSARRELSASLEALVEVELVDGRVVRELRVFVVVGNDVGREAASHDAAGVEQATGGSRTVRVGDRPREAVLGCQAVTTGLYVARILDVWLVLGVARVRSMRARADYCHFRPVLNPSSRQARDRE